MFYNFNAHRQKKPLPVSTSDPAARKIAGKIMAFQRRWANLMNRLCRKIPFRWLKLLVVLTGLVAGGFCLYLIFNNGQQLFFPAEKTVVSSSRLYLDSLENAVRLDSIRHPADYAPVK